MARKTEEYESRYLNLVEGIIENMDKKLDNLEVGLKDTNKENQKATQAINDMRSQLSAHRKDIKALNDEVFPNQPKNIKELSPWYRDTNILKLFTYIAISIVIMLSIYAALKGVSVPGV